jgi:molecular chaperone GrpE (heat shock protein)
MYHTFFRPTDNENAMQEQHDETNEQLLRKTQELAIEIKNLTDQHNSVKDDVQNQFRFYRQILMQHERDLKKVLEKT